MHHKLALKSFLPLVFALVAQTAYTQTPPPATPPAAPPATAAPPTTSPASPTKPGSPPANAAPVDPAKKAVVPPPGYVIGADDLLSIVFWREKDLSADVMVRPDGKISVPLLNDVEAAGLTPEQLRDRLMTQAQRLVEDANVTVVVRAINSRRVYITGQVARPGPYPLTGPMTVLQLIAIAGGVLEYADAEEILIMRYENGVPSNFQFNYKEVIRQKNLKQNIELRPGDTVVVP
jgi:polysaccharide biosynthesis/export protein